LQLQSLLLISLCGYGQMDYAMFDHIGP